METGVFLSWIFQSGGNINRRNIKSGSECKIVPFSCLGLTIANQIGDDRAVFEQYYKANTVMFEEATDDNCDETCMR